MLLYARDNYSIPDFLHGFDAELVACVPFSHAAQAGDHAVNRIVAYDSPGPAKISKIDLADELAIRSSQSDKQLHYARLNDGRYFAEGYFSRSRPELGFADAEWLFARKHNGRAIEG